VLQEKRVLLLEKEMQQQKQILKKERRNVRINSLFIPISLNHFTK
jgi:hypothetical protein